MWEAVRRVGDSDLTPLAAVAGTIADTAADFLAEHGATRVIVNNGGDLAIRLTGRESVGVGIRPDVTSPDVSHRILLTADMGIGGVATSGLSGRSFSRGVASAATVLASRAAIADAAATAVANATCVESESVVRRRAETIYPDTDLKGVEVTVSVGDLTDEEVEIALNEGVNRAERLVDHRLINAACLFVKGRMKSTRSLTGVLELLA